MNPAQKIRDLGIDLPAVAAPVASYVPAVRVDSMVYTSGQLPMVDGALVATGQLGAEIDLDRGVELTRTCLLNALAAAADLAGGIDHITRIVKVVIFVSSTADFHQQPEVANGASDLVLQIFGDAGRHARRAVGVAVLPRNAPVEVELICQVAD